MTQKEKVYKVVANISKGKVATYGQVARLCDTGPRVVGKYLHGNKDPKNIPCHRVVHADGSLAPSYAFGGDEKQKQLLENEGVIFKNQKSKFGILTLDIQKLVSLDRKSTRQQNKLSMKKNVKPIVDFLFEVGILSKTPRSGFHFLGSGEQSVSEHINRVVYVGYVLSIMEGKVDTAKILKMCLFHDLAEARTSDLNYVHQKYTESDEYKAISDLAKTLDFGTDIVETLKEFSERKTKESILAKDADQLEWILSLKEETDTGNSRAETWIPSAVKRLKTKSAKALAKKIIVTNSDDWWFADKKDSWWVSRDQEKMKKRF